MTTITITHLAGELYYNARGDDAAQVARSCGIQLTAAGAGFPTQRLNSAIADLHADGFTVRVVEVDAAIFTETVTIHEPAAANPAHRPLTWSAFGGGASPIDYLDAELWTPTGSPVKVTRPWGVDFRIEVNGIVVHQSPWHSSACATLNAYKAGVLP